MRVRVPKPKRTFLEMGCSAAERRDRAGCAAQRRATARAPWADKAPRRAPDRAGALDDIEEVPDVATAWVRRIHATDHREPLARRSADHDLRLRQLRWIHVKHISAHHVRAHSVCVRAHGPRVRVDCPYELEPRPLEAEIQTAGSAVERDRGQGRTIHRSGILVVAADASWCAGALMHGLASTIAAGAVAVSASHKRGGFKADARQSSSQHEA